MDSAHEEPRAPAPRVVARADHSVSRRDIDPDALKVLYRLQKANNLAYLVGGSVRDLLIGRTPKDFDVGTDATPATIRRLFRNSRTIGRRFPIVHVYFHGGKVVEVSTFRKNAPNGEAGPLARDENWGTPEEDAWRRDLTINGLFYDIDTFSVIDYVGGLEDLQRGVVRTIGDPYVRFREDPVRMIRAIRHAARIGFQIEPRTWEATRELTGLIASCAPARVLEEFLRELRGGAAAASIKLMSRSGLLEVLAPPLDDYVAHIEAHDPEEVELFWRRLEILDRFAAEEPLGDAVALAVVAGAVVMEEVNEAENGADGQRPDIGRVVRDTLIPTLRELGVPRRILEKCFHIFLAGRRLRRAADGGRIPRALFRKSYFPDSWLYVRILLESEGWGPDAIADLLSEPDGAPKRRSRRRRRRRRRGRRGGEGEGAESESDGDEQTGVRGERATEGRGAAASRGRPAAAR
jgi:poly(A) polymerase